MDFCQRINIETKGSCKVGAGPYGFGMSNPAESRLHLIVSMEPNPVDDVTNTIFTNSKNYMVGLVGVLTAEDGEERVYSADTVKEFSPQGSMEEQMKAALITLGTLKLRISSQTCHEVFGDMAVEQMNEAAKASQELEEETEQKQTGMMQM